MDVFDRARDDHQALLDLSIRHATWQIQTLLDDVAVYDLKALGLLTVDAAALTLIVATHDSLNHLWLGAAAVFLGASVWPRKWENGPDAEKFFAKNKGLVRLAFSENMLSELLEGVRLNVPKFRQKDWSFCIGFVLLGVGVFLGLAVAFFRPHASPAQPGSRPPASQSGGASTVQRTTR